MIHPIYFDWRHDSYFSTKGRIGLVCRVVLCASEAQCDTCGMLILTNINYIRDSYSWIPSDKPPHFLKVSFQTYITKTRLQTWDYLSKATSVDCLYYNAAMRRIHINHTSSRNVSSRYKIIYIYMSVEALVLDLSPNRLLCERFIIYLAT